MASDFRHVEQTLTNAIQHAGVKGKVRWYNGINEYKLFLYVRWDGTPTVASLGADGPTASAAVETYLQQHREYLRKRGTAGTAGTVRA